MWITPVRAATAGTVVVGALAFSLSFTALADLASQSGMTPGWMFPLVLDGMTVVATTATLALHTARGYAYFLLVLGSMASVAGNVAHSPHTTVGMGISAVPPLWLLAATHLTVLLVRQQNVREAHPLSLVPEEKAA